MSKSDALREETLGEYAKVIKELTEALDHYAKTGDAKGLGRRKNVSYAYNRRGTLYYLSGMYKNAVEDFSKSIKHEKSYYVAWYNRGSVLDDLGDCERAIEDISKSIQLKPDYRVAYNNRGFIKNKVGRYEEAILDLNKAIELKGTYSLAFKNRGVSYTKLNKFVKARKDLDKAIELDSENFRAFLIRGRLSVLEKKKKSEAMSDFKEASRIVNGLNDWTASFDELKRTISLEIVGLLGIFQNKPNVLTDLIVVCCQKRL